MKYILLIVSLCALCSCTSPEVRKAQSTAAANIYHAASALEQGVRPELVTPAIKKQALLIIQINGDTLKGVPNGD